MSGYAGWLAFLYRIDFHYSKAANPRVLLQASHFERYPVRRGAPEWADRSALHCLCVRRWPRSPRSAAFQRLLLYSVPSEEHSGLDAGRWV